MLQAGCDAHLLEPLTHLRCTRSLYETLVRLVSSIADRHCNGRIIATGGGYVYTVVPCAWTLVWSALCDVAAPDRVPDDWRAAVSAEAGVAVPATLRDPPDAWGGRSPLSVAAEENNRRTVDAVRRRSRRCLPVEPWFLSGQLAAPRGNRRPVPQLLRALVVPALAHLGGTLREALRTRWRCAREQTVEASG